MSAGDAGSIFAHEKREPTHEFPQSIFAHEKREPTHEFPQSIFESRTDE
ncbi:hypothetical protein [Haloarchaeobius sp. TZWSO28]